MRVKKKFKLYRRKNLGKKGEPMDDESTEKVEVKSKAKDKLPLPGQMFVLKKWNAVAMWSWDVECDTCAICRVQVMGENHLCCTPCLNYRNT